MKTGRMTVMAVALAMAAGVTMAAGVAAPGAQPKKVENQGWKLEVTPYVWLAGLEGDVKVNGQEADFDKSFSDLFDYVEAAASIFGTIQYDRFLIWGQADYFQMSTDKLDVEDRPQGGKIDTKMMLGEVAVGYQIDGWAEGQTFDVLVGVRGLHIDVELDVYGHGEFEKDKDLVDPMLIVRPSLPVLPSMIKGLRFNPTLAVGAGGDSDLVYEMFPEFQYQIAELVSVRLGYRTVGYKFKGDTNEDNELNVRLAGLVAGVGIMF